MALIKKKTEMKKSENRACKKAESMVIYKRRAEGDASILFCNADFSARKRSVRKEWGYPLFYFVKRQNAAEVYKREEPFFGNIKKTKHCGSGCKGNGA